jgi:hypothetical protein
MSKSRRGRPLKTDKLPNKVKQRNYRQRKKHAGNVAAIMKRVGKSEQAKYGPLRQLQINLFMLTPDAVQNYRRTLKENPDSKGRLHGESSGGFGWNELVLISAAIERDENGRRVRPRGCGIDS